MKKSNMTLTVKTLWIPVAILVLTYIAIGLLFTKMQASNADDTLKNELTKLIQSEKKQLHTGLQLVTSTQAPGDAFLGLEGDDDTYAREIVTQVDSMGLNAVYFTDLQGKVLYPKSARIPDEAVKAMKKASKSKGNVSVLYDDSKMVGFAPVVDVETTVGFLVFEAQIPPMLSTFANDAISQLTEASDVKVIQGDSISSYLEHAYTESKATSDQFLNRMIMITVTILFVALIVITIVLKTTSRNIVKPVKELLNAFKGQADGDLTQEIKVKSGDEIGDLMNTFNQTNQKLNKMIYQVSDHSNGLAESAAQLSEISKGIAENSHNQSEKTVQAVVSMEELSSSFEEVARNTAESAESSQKASDIATEGGQVVTEAVSGMERISNSVKESALTIEELGKRSVQIGEIVNVINDIASQTNLLALNAAIEAARAGEQGRGFAVVADEVRKLAERTTGATSEIGDMIKGIQEDTNKAVDSMQKGTKEVEEGEILVNKAGDSLKQIVEAVTHVTDMVQQIATAAEEQSATGAEVASGLETVSDMIKHTAESAQSSSGSTQNLDSLAHALQKVVGEFKLKNIEINNIQASHLMDEQEEENLLKA